MEIPKYVPARVKNFLSSLYAKLADTALLNQDKYSSQREQYVQYSHKLPDILDNSFERILQAGNVSDEEKKLIESVWLDTVLILSPPKPALKIFTKLAESEKVREELEFLIK